MCCQIQTKLNNDIEYAPPVDFTKKHVKKTDVVKQTQNRSLQFNQQVLFGRSIMCMAHLNPLKFTNNLSIGLPNV